MAPAEVQFRSEDQTSLMSKGSEREEEKLIEAFETYMATGVLSEQLVKRLNGIKRFVFGLIMSTLKDIKITI